MAFGSKCIKCDAVNAFEIQEFTLTGAAHRYYAIQCARCGGVVGALEFFNSGAEIKTLQEQSALSQNQIAKIEASLSVLVGQLNQILQRLPK